MTDTRLADARKALDAMGLVYTAEDLEPTMRSVDLARMSVRWACGSPEQTRRALDALGLLWAVVS